jgi:two-component system OmpR family response regulator
MNLLVVEDDVETAAALLRDLTNFGHSVDVAHDGLDAIFFAGSRDFDAIVLDRMLPLIDGLQVTKRLRNGANIVPILMLSALGDLAHRLEGLEGGADDYLVKPADPAEINARLQALLRRSKNEVAPQIVRFGSLEIDLMDQSVRCGESLLRLKPTEFRILRELIANVGQVVTRKMLLETVWGYHFEPESNIVEMHIHKLRQQLRYVSSENLISTVRGSGYMIHDA